jgi:tetratricopeptide (TPR) repeat protein
MCGGYAVCYQPCYLIARASRIPSPFCAMARWGQAMTLFQPLWPTRPGPDELQHGWELIQEAQELRTADSREAGFIVAAAAFFDPADEPDYWTRIERWADKQADLYSAYPTDVEVEAFVALSELATASLDDAPAAHHQRAAELMADVLAVEPTHPGAIHYTIHANDFPGREGESLEVVRRYSAIAPRNPHALHMPTHVFVRLGEWDEVILWNQLAAEAALAQPVGANGEFVWDEYPHAVEYLAYAHLQRGDERAARRVITELKTHSDLEPSFKTAFHLASTQARLMLERKDWSGAASLTARTPEYLDWDTFWWPEATVWHARGIGAARLGDSAGTARSLARLGQLEAQAASAGEEYFAVQIRILGWEVAAWQALLNGDAGQSIDLMHRAVALEEETPKHPVTPGPTLPARELLGDLYRELGNYRVARDEYSRSNARTPGRLNTILGLARTSEALGDSVMAARYYQGVLDLAVDDSTHPGVAEAKAHLPSR